MTNKTHLPDYDKPPLHEMVMGVQFASPKGYRQIYAREVWSLFEKKFPHIEEHQPLPPKVETFGSPQRGNIGLGFINGALHNRFWFLSEKKEELIQFQHDRFLHNWRKIGDGDNPYPRFESIIKEYEKELTTLEEYFSNFDSGHLNVNHYELNYINNIPLIDETSTAIGDWIGFLDIKDIDPDDLSVKYQKILKDSEKNPYGRLVCDLSSGVDRKGNPAISLNITVSGIPKEPTIKSAIEFLKNANKLIVIAFDGITTDFAHKQWRKK